MNRCAHRVVIKRPESGPGTSSDSRPGEWFCNDCPQWWDTYEDVLAATGGGSVTGNPRFVAFEALMGAAEDRAVQCVRGDGRAECERCGKWVFEVIHSCKGIPVTIPAWNRYLDELIERWHTSPDDGMPLHTFLGMTWAEYAAWTTDPSAVPARFLGHAYSPGEEA
ncbi:hypothetical protein SEA_MARSHA_80 [Mycobacterium phage Marsha]|uniref:Uncharacterized protein n=1 Tax=Mycobacterium phage Courthouse TaxID=2923000 RepID=G8I5D0_9CAUD|nr:hypothetical protein CM09_gp073 [Mycobacterium phage Courthouse]AER47924.1 hypothetical protein COURTHOUSE_73 [Mycobacterium phage Courthouse]QWY82064.1 hypothetical protein SEA_MARSHA_80 [Mycobacterium phage Marsha]